MEKSHAADRGSGQPTLAQLRELLAQIEKGRVTKDSLQRFLRGSTQPVTVETAREIMGPKSFFGPDQWKEFFDKKFQLASIPEIPWTREELANPGTKQEHFLFLGLECLDGKPLSLPEWHKVFPGKGHPKFYSDWYLGRSFAQKTGGTRWYLMPVGIIEGSNNLLYDRQVSMLPNEYEVPLAVERVSANILYCLLNGGYLDTDFWARTSDQSDGGGRVIVLGDSGHGLFVDYWDGDAGSDIGVAASRKFLG